MTLFAKLALLANVSFREEVASTERQLAVFVG